MKKFLTSITVIISFLVYSIYQRSYGQYQPAIVPQSVNSPSSGVSQNSVTNMPVVSSILFPTNSSSISPAIKPTNPPTLTPTSSSGYKNGSYTGDAADAFYGMIQVQATISNGRITDVQFLQYPNDRSRSIEINQQADPMLAQEAIQAQSSNVDIVSGATDSSQAFIQSLSSALSKAKN